MAQTNIAIYISCSISYAGTISITCDIKITSVDFESHTLDVNLVEFGMKYERFAFVVPYSVTVYGYSLYFLE